MNTPVCVWRARAELGEGPVWDAAARAVWFVDIKGRRVHRYDEDGGLAIWPAPQQVSFILPVDDGGWVCALQDGLYRFSPATGEFTLARHVERHLAGNRFNDAYADARGGLWFGSMDDAETRPTGSLYRLDASGRLVMLDTGYIIPNGPAMSPDGRTLYHTDTLARTVYSFDVRPDGTLGAKRPLIVIAGRGHPDGMAVDAEGTLWVALFGGGCIERYTPAGAYIDAVRLPCSNVTKLAFGGEDLRTVYITTAWKGLTADVRTREPLAGGLFTLEVDVPGLAPHRVAAGALA